MEAVLRHPGPFEPFGFETKCEGIAEDFRVMLSFMLMGQSIRLRHETHRTMHEVWA